MPPCDRRDTVTSGWAVETSLDVEDAHVVAPKADILLVERPVTETEEVPRASVPPRRPSQPAS